MNTALVVSVLLLEAIALFLLVLGTHSLRHKHGMGHFYALMGAITAVMSWVTEVGVNVELYGITFFIGSTVFYTSILLGVFIVYVFDGPEVTRRVIVMVIGVSILVPLVLASLDYQMNVLGFGGSDMIPVPKFRINTASVVATFLDLVFLAVAWEFLGKPKFRMPLWLRSYLTLIGVMWLDVLLFATGAFAGTDVYLTIMKGTFSSRLVVSIIAFPFLWSYMSWENSRKGFDMEVRPVLAIIQHAAEVEHELSLAQKEITERKRVEAALRESEEKYRDVTFCSSDWVWEVNVSGEYTYTSGRVEQILGYTPEELIGKTPFEMMPEKEKRRIGEIFQTIASKKEAIVDLENWNLSKNGELVCLLTNGIPLIDSNGELVGYRGVDKDITERKRLEEERKTMEAQLRQSQKLESLGTLAGGVAHEINNPIMGIMGYADIIQGGVDEEKLKKFTEGIKEESQRIATIVKNLLSFARQDMDRHSPACIKDIVGVSQSLLGAVFCKHKITVETSIPADLPKVKCRSQQIQQVVINLLTNARDALNQRYEGWHENKLIRISAGSFEKDNETWVRTTVEDHGTGIPEEIIEHIFDPFFTTKDRSRGTPSAAAPAGTGLGLSVSHGIITDHHHGRLWVESVEGEYTRFHIELRVDNGWSLEGAE